MIYLLNGTGLTPGIILNIFVRLCIVFYYVYVFLFLFMLCSVYSVSLCCSMYCLCVNVYWYRVSTQLHLTNISYHIYIYIYIYISILLKNYWILSIVLIGQNVADLVQSTRRSHNRNYCFVFCFYFGLQNGEIFYKEGACRGQSDYYRFAGFNQLRYECNVIVHNTKLVIWRYLLINNRSLLVEADVSIAIKGFRLSVFMLIDIIGLASR